MIKYKHNQQSTKQRISEISEQVPFSFLDLQIVLSPYIIST